MGTAALRKVEPARLVAFLIGDGANHALDAAGSRHVVGVIEGTGIGPEVIRATLDVLAAVEQATGIRSMYGMGDLSVRRRRSASASPSPIPWWRSVGGFRSGWRSSVDPAAAAMCTTFAGISICSASLFRSSHGLRWPGLGESLAPILRTWICSWCATTRAAYTRVSGENGPPPRAAGRALVQLQRVPGPAAYRSRRSGGLRPPRQIARDCQTRRCAHDQRPVARGRPCHSTDVSH